jgi:hypothetical protein
VLSTVIFVVFDDRLCQVVRLVHLILEHFTTFVDFVLLGLEIEAGRLADVHELGDWAE